jgi:CRISPR/Cas system-associated exonuclease Cas4 (RecB family)
MPDVGTKLPMKLFPPPSIDFSQSSLQDYADCPRRFQLRYLGQLEWPGIQAEPSLEVESRQEQGQEFHRLVHQYYVGISPADLQKTARTSHVRGWWENFRAANLDLEGWQLRSELTLAANIGARRLVAKYDLVACQDGRAVIYDWKTWARRPSNEWLAGRWQTRVYRALLVKAGAVLNGGRPLTADAVSMIYWFAEFPGEPAILEYDAIQFEEDWSSIESLIAEIVAGQSFPVTEDRRRCRFCVYRSYCARGERAGDWNEPGSEASGDWNQDISLNDLGESAI